MRLPASMTAVALRWILLFFLTGAGQGRILRLNSSDDHLISDGVSHVEKNEGSSVGASGGPSIPATCDHQYGFLPCAENAAGYIFQILVYQGLLIYGEKELGSGSKVLLNILGVQKFGGIVFRILMALPSMVLMIVSGVFSTKENAQSKVSLGIGIYAGMTVFSLTLQWGICLIVGKTDLKEKSYEQAAEASSSNCLAAKEKLVISKDTGVSIDYSSSNCLAAKEKLVILKDTGVSIDQQTRDTARIMLLSLIPYIVVQLVDKFHTPSGNRFLTLVALIVSSLALISYFIYQILNPWIQQRILDYSKYEILRKGFLQHVQRQGQLVDEDGKLNRQVVKKLFADTDKDANRRITKAELQNLVLEIIKTGKVKVDEKFAVSEVMETFDVNDDRIITEEEFIRGCEKWIKETNQSSQHGDSTSRHLLHDLTQIFRDKKEGDKKEDDDLQEIDKIMSKILRHAETQLLKSKSLITDGKPNTEHIKSLFKEFDYDGDGSISTSELEQFISTVKFGELELKYEDIVKELFEDFDQDHNNIIDESEFLEGLKRWLDKVMRVANTQDGTRSIEEFDKIVWKAAVQEKWALIKSIFQVLLGIVILTFLGGPLMVSILQLSHAMGLPSFSISSVIVPLAMNARALTNAVLPASQKSTRTASLTFSEIYSGVIMNNISGLTTLLAIVYAKDLTWDFSAEVLTILVVCAVIGILAFSCNNYPLWTCILAFFLYPFSLGMYYFAQVFLNWN